MAAHRLHKFVKVVFDDAPTCELHRAAARVCIRVQRHCRMAHVRQASAQPCCKHANLPERRRSGSRAALAVRSAAGGGCATGPATSGPPAAAAAAPAAQAAGCRPHLALPRPTAAPRRLRVAHCGFSWQLQYEPRQSEWAMLTVRAVLQSCSWVRWVQLPTRAARGRNTGNALRRPAVCRWMASLTTREIGSHLCSMARPTRQEPAIERGHHCPGAIGCAAAAPG